MEGPGRGGAQREHFHCGIWRPAALRRPPQHAHSCPGQGAQASASLPAGPVNRSTALGLYLGQQVVVEYVVHPRAARHLQGLRRIEYCPEVLRSNAPQAAAMRANGPQALAQQRGHSTGAGATPFHCAALLPHEGRGQGTHPTRRPPTPQPHPAAHTSKLARSPAPRPPGPPTWSSRTSKPSPPAPLPPARRR